MSPNSKSIITSRWTPLRYHPEQSQYWMSQARYNIVPAGRRSGKTELAKRKIVTRSMLPPELGGSKFPDPRYFAAAPTRDQAKRIYWEDLKKFVPKDLRSRPPSESNLIIYTATGAQIHVLGMDKPERIEGTPWDGGILDEYGNMKKTAWPNHVRPALSDRRGWCDMIGVPEGRNHYYGEYKIALADDTGTRRVFHWYSADILPAEEIADAKSSMDELTYKQEYEGSFVDFQGRAYYAFTRKVHSTIIKKKYYDPRKTLILCFDFNVEPGTATILQETQALDPATKLPLIGRTMTSVIGEVWIPRNSNTILVCNKIVTDWRKHAGPIHCYGDYTGGARGSAKVQGTDWDLIKKKLYKHFGQQVVFYIRKNPREKDRVNAVNTRLKTMSGDVNLMVDSANCPRTVEDFEGVVLLEGGSGEIDKNSDKSLTHLTDGLGYYVHYRFPVGGQFSSQEV